MQTAQPCSAEAGEQLLQDGFLRQRLCCELTISTTVWLGMNSNTPSLAITRKDVVGVTWRTTISGSANTPMDSAAAALRDECGRLATLELILQQHHVGNSKHDSNLTAAHALHARASASR